MIDPTRITKRTCPWCGSSNVYAEEHDYGTREPYGCEDCHAVEISARDIDPGDRQPTPEEKACGWWKGGGE